MEEINQRLATLEDRLDMLERTSHRGDARSAASKAKPAPPPNGGRLFLAVEDLSGSGRQQSVHWTADVVGFHRTTEHDTDRVYQWQLANTSDALLTMDDEHNVRVLSALANPIRPWMMKAILQQPGTAAELRERLGLSSTGQTYHAINALLNGGMIRQDGNGAFEAVGNMRSGFPILLGGLASLTDSKYRPAFDPSTSFDTTDDASASQVE